MRKMGVDGTGRHMTGRWRRTWWLVAMLALGLSGCPAKPKPAPIVVVADEDRIEWAAEEPVFVVVRTSCRTLDVYRFGDRIRSYPAVFGFGGSHDKLYEGDMRTPTGLYAIVAQRHHPRWRRFLLLDYPNLRDVQRYQVAMASGAIPMLGDRAAGVGSAVGIHGTDKPNDNRRQFDWTHGCISLSNADVEDLSRLVPNGTPVLIGR
jgi:murein L,D-transpeptidase YafK